MKIELVVFDIAGTTVKDNDNVAQAFQNALRKFEFDVPLENINRYMGYEKHKAIREILRTYFKLTEIPNENLIEGIHQEFVNQMLYYYENSSEIKALPNVESTFDQLRELNVKIGLNTGFSRVIVDVILKKLGWDSNKMIDFVIASDEVENGRPFPDMIQSLMQQAGITDPGKVAKIGDTEVDVNEGKNIGCQYVIAITTGSFSRNELAIYRPTHIIDDMSELVHIITS